MRSNAIYNNSMMMCQYMCMCMQMCCIGLRSKSPDGM